MFFVVVVAGHVFFTLGIGKISYLGSVSSTIWIPMWVTWSVVITVCTAAVKQTAVAFTVKLRLFGQNLKHLF